MRRTTITMVFATLAVSLVTSCKGPPVPNPLSGETRYLCCNLWFEKPKVVDVGYEQGTRIPAGTRVQIMEVYRAAVKFQAEGYPPVEIAYKVNPKGGLPFDTYLQRLFVAENPRSRLRKVPAKTLQAIDEGAVEPGMTRDQVLMAVGYPPAHMTPSLDSASWRYWRNRRNQYVVYFNGDKVERVQN